MSCAFAVNKIKLLSVLASEEGLRHIKAEFPGLEVRALDSMIRVIANQIWRKIWVAGVDSMLTTEGIVSPGLGDTVGGAYTVKVKAELFAGRSPVQYHPDLIGLWILIGGGRDSEIST